MTDRLREKARELANYIGFDSETSNLGYEEAIAEIYSALLSERDRALEEAAEKADEREAICADAVKEIEAGRLYPNIVGAKATENCARLEASHIASIIRKLKSKQ